MKDVIDELHAVRRTVGDHDDGSRVVVLRRSYDAQIEDVWDALTNADRLKRWFLPISGDLRLGGKYQFEGNAGGEILRCEPPRLLKVSWVYNEGYSEVEVRLSAAAGADQTEFELEHVAQVPPEFWDQFGPGAVGVGWDGGLLGLARHLAGHDIEDPQAWESSPEAREFLTASSKAWGDALRATGTPEADVARMVQNTTNFYAPDPPPR